MRQQSTNPVIFAPMALFNYMIWNGSPVIMEFGSFSLRWYGLFFALGFLISQQLLYYMFKKEGKPEKDVDTLTIYMVISTIIGARLGHVLFYDIEMLWNDPLQVFLPFEFSPFRFTGLQGLASHGAAIGILFALWLYARKRKPGQNYMQILDRIVILVALTGALIRLGNYFNSEIIGKPTDKGIGVVFVNRLTEALEETTTGDRTLVQSVEYARIDSVAPQNGIVPLHAYVFFEMGVSEAEARNVLDFDVNMILSRRLSEFFDISLGKVPYELGQEKDGRYAAKITVNAISRHPAQLYEAISCVLLFLLLFGIWIRYKENLPTGLIFGIFMIVLWTLRFLYEFLKEPQADFENTMPAVFGHPLFMGQLLSIPMVIVGIFVLLRALGNNNKSETASQ